MQPSAGQAWPPGRRARAWRSRAIAAPGCSRQPSQVRLGLLEPHAQAGTVSESSWAGLAWSTKRQNTTLGIDHCEKEKNDGQETPPSEAQGSPARRFAGQAE